MSLPTLGVGLGFRESFKSELFLQRQQVDFLEIVAEHYLDASRQKEQELEVLAAHFPIIPHAINLSLGSAEGLDTDYLRQLAALIKRLNPPWWSEHICFTTAGGIDIGHLSPLPYTKEAVDVLCRNIAEVRRWIDVPLKVAPEEGIDPPRLDLVRYEKAWLEASEPTSKLTVCWLSYDIDKLAVLQEVRVRKAIAIWFRMKPRGKLHHGIFYNYAYSRKPLR